MAPLTIEIIAILPTCEQKSAVSISRSVAAKQYVAAYLTIHLNLTSQLNSSGTQGWDLTTFKPGCIRGCSIKVKYRESGNSVQIGVNMEFDFLVCVVRNNSLRIDSSNLQGKLFSGVPALPARRRSRPQALIVQGRASRLRKRSGGCAQGSEKKP